MSRTRLEADDAAEVAALADAAAYVDRNLREATRHRPGLAARELLAATQPDHEDPDDV